MSDDTKKMDLKGIAAAKDFINRKLDAPDGMLDFNEVALGPPTPCLLSTPPEMNLHDAARQAQLDAYAAADASAASRAQRSLEQSVRRWGVERDPARPRLKVHAATSLYKMSLCELMQMQKMMDDLVDMAKRLERSEALPLTVAVHQHEATEVTPHYVSNMHNCMTHIERELSQRLGTIEAVEEDPMAMHALQTLAAERDKPVPATKKECNGIERDRMKMEELLARVVARQQPHTSGQGIHPPMGMNEVYRRIMPTHIIAPDEYLNQELVVVDPAQRTSPGEKPKSSADARHDAAMNLIRRKAKGHLFDP